MATNAWYLNFTLQAYANLLLEQAAQACHIVICCVNINKIFFVCHIVSVTPNL